ncbi:MAG: hypothetical protein NWE89_08785 [Candidatus Bathyarchaeota archaeon]|nr:hypothetical protein [Candidatus Bathyarchaeota archaeon]
MAANPFLALGLVAGVIAAIFVYWRGKNRRDTAIAFISGFLAFGTPLHFIVVSLYVGPWVNKQIYRRWNHNWGSWIISLIGLLPLYIVYQAPLRLVVAWAASQTGDLGGAVIVGVGFALILIVFMFIGLAVYVLASLYVTLRRRGEASQSDS